jgi:type III pantothenate kinase
MSVNLCIDWGNTNIRASVFVDGTVKHQSTIEADNAAGQLETIKATWHPERSILCSVADHPDDLEKMLAEGMKSFIKLDGFTRTPINNAYSTPETLGPDRLAMVAAAHHLFPDKNNLIICAGTCITYNLVQKSRTFRGGAISPGLAMRFRAMNEFTDKLPEVEAEGPLLLLGYDTETCMRGGVVYGMAAEIDGMINAYTEAYPDFNAILTGGDAPFFADKLKSKIFADPGLVLKGLNIICDYNASLFG